MYSVSLLKRHLLRRRLPVELIAEIFDFAEYWPCATSCLSGTIEVYKDSASKSQSTTSSEAVARLGIKAPSVLKIAYGDTFLLRTAPLAMRPCVDTREERDRKQKRGIDRWTSRLTRKFGRSSVHAPIWHPPRGGYPCRKVVFEILSLLNDFLSGRSSQC